MGEAPVICSQSPDQNSKFCFENSLRNSDFDNPRKSDINLLKMTGEKGKRHFHDKDKIMFHRSKVFKVKGGSFRTMSTFTRQFTEQ